MVGSRKQTLADEGKNHLRKNERACVHRVGSPIDEFELVTYDICRTEGASL